MHKLILTTIIVIPFGIVGQAAEGKNMLMPKRATLNLNETIRWQKKIIRHDRWVIHTAATHHNFVVKFHRAQLRWTMRELRESLSSLRQQESRVALVSSICYACWDRVASCESGQNWSIISKPYDKAGHTFKGGLQFKDSTWAGSGGLRYASTANLATREQQIAIAAPLSLSNWPVCGSRY